MVLEYVDIGGMKKKKLISGSRTYKNIIDELHHHGINLNTLRTTEGFMGNRYYISPTEDDIIKSNEDKDCPYISFYEGNKDYFCANGRNISGCINGSRGSGISPFDAAYNVVGTYLTSLPNPTQDNMNKCATLKKENIKEMKLCDSVRLGKKTNFQNLINEGKAKPLFNDIDYTENNKIVNAINKACVTS